MDMYTEMFVSISPKFYTQVWDPWIFFLPLALSQMEYLSLVCVNYGSQNFDCYCCTRNFVFDSLITNQTLENENENCLFGKFILYENYFNFEQKEP